MANFDLRDLKGKAPLPDLGAVAQQQARQAQIMAMRQQDPWFGIGVNINELPNSVVYELLMTEALSHSQNATTLQLALEAGDPNHIFPKNIPPAQIPAVVSSRINMEMQIANVKSRLALAAASAMGYDTDRPHWFNAEDGGQRTTPFALAYLAKKTAEREASEAPPAEAAAETLDT